MTKGDKILISLIFFLSFFSMIYSFVSNVTIDEKIAIISINGKMVKKIVFSPEVTGKRIPIRSQFGLNIVEVGDGKIRVIEASCKDKLDVKQSYIDRPGEMIVCLPNRLVIEILGGEKESEIDSLSR